MESLTEKLEGTKLVIPREEDSPLIELSQISSGEYTINIEGISRLEYTKEFYEPLINKIKEINREKGKISRCDVNLKYYNTETSRQLQNIFMELKKQPELTINWYYGGKDIDKDIKEDMKTGGEEYKEVIGIHNFNIIEIS